MPEPRHRARLRFLANRCWRPSILARFRGCWLPPPRTMSWLAEARRVGLLFDAMITKLELSRRVELNLQYASCCFYCGAFGFLAYETCVADRKATADRVRGTLSPHTSSCAASISQEGKAKPLPLLNVTPCNTKRDGAPVQ